MIYKTSDLLYTYKDAYILIIEGNTLSDIFDIIIAFPDKPDIELWKGAELINQEIIMGCKGKGKGGKGKGRGK